MITAKELRSKLDVIIDVLMSDYTPAQWDAKSEVDKARYKEAKKVYKEAENAIDLEEIDWDDDSDDDDYYAISNLMDVLKCKIEIMEEDLNIY